MGYWIHVEDLPTGGGGGGGGDWWKGCLGCLGFILVVGAIVYFRGKLGIGFMELLRYALILAVICFCARFLFAAFSDGFDLPLLLCGAGGLLLGLVLGGGVWLGLFLADCLMGAYFYRD